MIVYCIDIENGLFKTERRWFLFKHKNEVAKCISFSLNLRLIWLPKQVTLYFFSEEIHKSGDATFFCQDSKYVLVWSNSDLWKSRDDINLRINFDNYLFFRAERFFCPSRVIRRFSNKLNTQHLFSVIHWQHRVNMCTNVR